MALGKSCQVTLGAFLQVIAVQALGLKAGQGRSYNYIHCPSQSHRLSLGTTGGEVSLRSKSVTILDLLLSALSHIPMIIFKFLQIWA